MIFADCPVCLANTEFHTLWRDGEELCQCDECGQMFEIDEDADFNGDHYVDCSTPGRRVWSEAMGITPAEFYTNSAAVRERLGGAK